MLGAQALRTKQKVDQKEREKRHKERQRNLEVQRERIQRAANEDAQAAMLEYAAAESAAASTSITDEGDGPSPAELAHRFHQLAMGGGQPISSASGSLSSQSAGVNRKIHQRYSLNAASYHQMPSSARESISYDHVPKRSPSTDCGHDAMGRSSCSGSSGHTTVTSTNRFLRWLGIGNSSSISGISSKAHKQTNNSGVLTARHDSRQSSAEKRRMSTY